MKEPRLFESPENISGGVVVFSRANSAYLKNVLRLKNHDQIIVFDGTAEYSVELGSLREKVLIGTVIATKAGESSGSAITLAFSCVRPSPTEEILRHGTELGVTKFVPILSSRANRRPREKKERWSSIVASACAQSRRICIPEIEDPTVLNDFLSGSFAGSERLLLSLRADAEPLLSVLPECGERSFHILTGPEGGFESFEEEAAMVGGFRPVKLTRATLRAETAALLSVGIISAWFTLLESSR